MYHGLIKYKTVNVVVQCGSLLHYYYYFLLKRNKYLIITITEILRILRLYYIPPRLNKLGERKTERRP